MISGWPAAVKDLRKRSVRARNFATDIGIGISNSHGDARSSRGFFPCSRWHYGRCGDSAGHRPTSPGSRSATAKTVRSATPSRASKLRPSSAWSPRRRNPSPERWRKDPARTDRPSAISWTSGVSGRVELDMLRAHWTGGRRRFQRRRRWNSNFLDAATACLSKHNLCQAAIRSAQLAAAAMAFARAERCCARFML